MGRRPFVPLGPLVVLLACGPGFRDGADTEGDDEAFGDEGKGDGFGSGGGDEGKDDGWSEANERCEACMEVHAGSCEALIDACEASVACQALWDCPWACGWTASCVAECNEVIPTGVAPLREGLQCLMCGSAPCVDECAASSWAPYCG